MEERTVKSIIEEELVYQAQSIKDLEFGSEEYSRAVKGVEGLYKQTIEDSKADIDYRETELKETELELKEKELEKAMSDKDKELELKEKELKLKEKELEDANQRARWEFWKGVGITAASLLIPAALHYKLSMKGFKFEETGTIGSSTMRSVQNSEQAFVKRHL